MQEQDIAFMRRCLELAAAGKYTCAPNPMVGSVIVYEGQIIGEGYHHHAGGPHAEVVAIRSVQNKSLLKDSTIYVSLEPCSHHGRTPPCSDLIIKSNIPRVKIATRDFNSLVNGKGIQKLKDAGLEVEEGIMEAEAQNLNAKFFTFHGECRPYITLKWAQSADRIIDPERSESNTGTQWISSTDSQVFAHQLRAEHQAILVGSNTVLNDNPSLDTRAFKGKDPIRIILDPSSRLSKDHKVFRDSNFIRFTRRPEFKNDVLVKSNKPLVEQVAEFAYQNGIQSILIEGGAYTLKGFIEKGMWDEAFVIEAPHLLKKGLQAPVMNHKISELIPLGADRVKHYYK